MSSSKRWLFLVGFCLLYVVIVACSSEPTAQNEYETSPSEKNVVSLDESPQQTMNHSSHKQNNAIKNAEKQGRKITYKATVLIDVNNYQKSRNTIEKLINQAQGYLVDSTEQQNRKSEQTGTFTYRLPQGNFHSFINNLKVITLNGDVRQIAIKGNDVTEEMVDLNARLKAKKATETRLFDLMNKATDSSALLRISQQLDTVQVEIEQIEGRLQFLKHRIDFSEVIVTLTQEEVVFAPDNASMGQKMKETFLKSIKGIINVGKNVLIFLAGAIPVLIVLGLIILPIYFLIRNRFKRKKNHEIK